MKEEEGLLSRLLVLVIEFLDPFPGQSQQGRVFRHRFSLRVPEVGQQGKVQMGVPIGQESDFERFDEMLDMFNAAEHRRNHDQRARLRGDAFGEVQARERMWRDQHGCQPVDQCDRQLARAEE